MKNYVALIVGLVVIIIGVVVIFIPPIFDLVSNNILAVITIVIGCFITIVAAIKNG